MTALGHGIKYLKITTDPVELWAGPSSKSRVEREFFDSNFEPFYRIEQIIIKSNAQNFTYPTSNGPLEFGPAFDKEFLREVLWLQNNITSMQAIDFVAISSNIRIKFSLFPFRTGRKYGSQFGEDLFCPVEFGICGSS